MNGDRFLFQWGNKFCPMKSLIEPFLDPSEGYHSALPLAADHYFIATYVDLEGFERTRRWAGNIAAVQVIQAVMAGAPNLVQVVAVLNSTAQVCANRR